MDPVLAGMVGNALRMIAGGGSDHAAGALVAAQRKQLIKCAAFFKGTGALLVVELKKNGILCETRKSLGVCAGGNTNVGANPAKRGLDVCKLDHEDGAIILPDSDREP